MDSLQIIHNHVDYFERSVLVGLDSDAGTILDGGGEVIVVGLTHCFHPHLELIGSLVVLIPADGNTCLLYTSPSPRDA